MGHFSYTTLIKFSGISNDVKHSWKCLDMVSATVG